MIEPVLSRSPDADAADDGEIRRPINVALDRLQRQTGGAPGDGAVVRHGRPKTPRLAQRDRFAGTAVDTVNNSSYDVIPVHMFTGIFQYNEAVECCLGLLRQGKGDGEAACQSARL